MTTKLMDTVSDMAWLTDVRVSVVDDLAPRPADYGLHHDDFRPYQANGIGFCMNIADRRGFGFVEAPTGSGKTSLAKAVGSRYPVITLTRTKSLQAENYGRDYGFDVLFGRSNYSCAHADANTYATADDCLHADKMHECPYADLCTYLSRKQAAQDSNHAALNYSYWLTARWPRESNARAVFLDEAHLLSDIVLDFAGCTITEIQRREFGLAAFPKASSAQASSSMFFANVVESPIDNVLKWLETSLPIMINAVRILKKGDDQKKARRADALRRKIENTWAALTSSQKDWYIRSGPDAKTGVDGAPEPALIARPLTARYHFPKYFIDAERRGIVAMSATIGDMQTFAEELGVVDWQGHILPNQWPSQVRPIQFLKDSPAMGQAAKKDLTTYDRQADVIAKAINGVPAEWSGVIHVTAKYEALALAKRLAARGLSDRVWVPNEKDGTDKQLAAWGFEKQRVAAKSRKGALAVTWAWHEGVNLTEERICGVAKTPFPFLGDPYERERQMYSGSFFLQRTAWQLTQALGRTRRGEASDYDLNGQREQLVFIADRNYRRCQKYIPADIREAIVEA